MSQPANEKALNFIKFLVKNMKLSEFSDKEIIEQYVELLSELQRRNLLRSNNLVSDYGELVVSKALDLKLVRLSTKGYDAIDKNGRRYQIKSRREGSLKKSRQLGVLRNLDENVFDYLVAIIFDKDFSVKEIWKMPRTTALKYARFSNHQNGFILVMNDKILFDPTIEQIKL